MVDSSEKAEPENEGSELELEAECDDRDRLKEWFESATVTYQTAAAVYNLTNDRTFVNAIESYLIWLMARSKESLEGVS
jgi:hypothetical protein